ncbi:MAG: hypothetical protein WC389_11335 [Lutibacter sp.]|jgi:hypothetical protein
MKSLLYFKYFVIFFFLQTGISNAQTTFSNEGAIEFIKDYYSNFQTGYDFDGKYKFISNNYKATFSDSNFTLTFDTFDDNKITQHQTVTFNLKDITAIEPNGGDVIEILGTETIILPICGKLAFKTKEEAYEINIYYEVDEDVTTTEIYKGFVSIWKSHI